MYGQMIALDSRDLRAHLLSLRKDGKGLQPELINFVKDYVGNMSNTVFFDVGANYGEWTLALRDTVRAAVAVEPHPHLAQLLRENFSGLKKVEVHEVALSNADGEAEFHYREGYSGGSSLHEQYLSGLNPRVWRGIGRMATTTVETRETGHFLAEMFAPYAVETASVVIKLDIEGAEGLVLSGVHRFLSGLKNWVLVSEFNPTAIEAIGEDPADTWASLKNLGICRVFSAKDASLNQAFSVEMVGAEPQPIHNSDVIVTPRLIGGTG